MAGTIPEMFFLNKKLHKKIKVVKSDNAVVAWCYEDEKRLWYPRMEVRRNFKKAYTITHAAKLMNVPRRTIVELIEKKMVPAPVKAYDLTNYRPTKAYISEDDMLDYRQSAWDQLPKNRFGEPYKDTMLSEVELIHVMATEDDRDFVIEGDDVIRVYKV